MSKWEICLELFHWLQGYNAAAQSDKRIPQHYLDALAGVLGERTLKPPEDVVPTYIYVGTATTQEALNNPSNWRRVRECF
jgi:hypothetical protein